MMLSKLIHAKSKFAPELQGANFVFDGNSYTSGYLATTAYPNRLVSTLAATFGKSVTLAANAAVAGQNTTNMISRAVTFVTPYYNPAKLNLLFAWEVGNEISGIGVDAAVLNFKNYCNARRSEGFKVVALTCVPRINVSDSLLVPANTRLLAEWQDYCDCIIDTRSVSGLATINATYYNADNVHLNDSGYQLVAELITTKII